MLQAFLREEKDGFLGAVTGKETCILLSKSKQWKSVLRWEITRKNKNENKGEAHPPMKILLFRNKRFLTRFLNFYTFYWFKNNTAEKCRKYKNVYLHEWSERKLPCNFHPAQESPLPGYHKPLLCPLHTPSPLLSSFRLSAESSSLGVLIVVPIFLLFVSKGSLSAPWG